MLYIFIMRGRNIWTRLPIFKSNTQKFKFCKLLHNKGQTNTFLEKTVTVQVLIFQIFRIFAFIIFYEKCMENNRKEFQVTTALNSKYSVYLDWESFDEIVNFKRQQRNYTPANPLRTAAQEPERGQEMKGFNTQEGRG